MCYNGARTFKDNLTVTNFTVARHVTLIDHHVFSGCTSITSLLGLAGSKVTTIGCKAFAGTSITSLDGLGDDVRMLHCNAFEDCELLRSADLFKVTTVEPSAFYGCINLNCVHLLRSVRYFKRTTSTPPSFPPWCDVRRMEPHIRAIFLLCLQTNSDVGLGRRSAVLGTLTLRLARDHFRESGECIGPWRQIPTYI